jgi:hypothetical protein
MKAETAFNVFRHPSPERNNKECYQMINVSIEPCAKKAWSNRMMMLR